MEEIILEIDLVDIGKRVDKYLNEKIERKSRSFIQGLIEQESVFVNDKIVKSNYKVRNSDIIRVLIKEPEVLKVEAEDIPLEISYF